MSHLIPQEHIESEILVIRDKKVMLDRDLATLYGVTTGNLNKAVARNLDRFPEDFMLQLTQQEFENLMFHFGISSWGGIRKQPRAFTEHGILMLSSVLKSKRAVHVNIQIMRTFAKLRGMALSYKQLQPIFPFHSDTFHDLFLLLILLESIGLRSLFFSLPTSKDIAG